MSYLNYGYAADVKIDLATVAFVEVNVVDEVEDEDVLDSLDHPHFH